MANQDTYLMQLANDARLRYPPSPEQVLGSLREGPQRYEIFPKADVYDEEIGKLLDIIGEDADNGGVMYFRTETKMKGGRVKRGKWESKNKAKTINDSQGNAIGYEKSFRYKSRGGWKMHEYGLSDEHPSTVVCKITRSKRGSSRSTETNEVASTSIAAYQSNEEYSTYQGYLDGPIRSPDNRFLC